MLRNLNGVTGFMIIASGLLSCTCGIAQEYVIDTDFPGGNIIISNGVQVSTLYSTITSDTVLLRPDFRDTKKSWFNWYFRISGAADRTILFQFPGKHIGSFGPAVSIDGGDSWSWLYDTISTLFDQFNYTFREDIDEVRFSMGVPYMQSHLDQFLSGLKGDPLLRVGTLTSSVKGRSVEKLVIQHQKSRPKFRVLLTARHHSCEAMASYALEGIIYSVLQDNDESMKWLRENTAFFIVPFMDKDGVEDGDQGKNRKPWDHNEDYAGESIYNTTAALRKQVPVWADDDVDLFLDLHCPGLRGTIHETIFTVESGDPVVAREQRAFLEILKEHNNGELKLHPGRSIIEYGTGWNVSRGNSELRSSREWVSETWPGSMSATLEIAYANNNGQMVTPQNARDFGKDVAIAIAAYLLRR